MATTNLLQAVGLQTFNNNLDLPPGSLLQAENVNIDRNGVIEPRRGFTQWQTVGSDASMYAYQLISYKGRILAHYPYTTENPLNPISGKLAYDNNAGDFVDFSGDFEEVEVGVRIKSVEMNGNLYFTTSNGIKKIAAKTASDLSTTTITDAGPVRALDVELNVNTSGAGFLEANKQVGYRIVWGVRDDNDNLILGYPSPLNVIGNLGTQEVSVNVKFYVPEEINLNSNYFYQIYRTQQYTTTTPPSDELKLVYEGFNDKATNWVTDHYEILDQYSDTLRQANTNLYTNQYSGEGIAFGNLKPPIAKDTTAYKNHVFYSNIQTNHQLINTLLGVSNFTYVNISSISGTTTKTITTSVDHNLQNNDKIALRGTALFDGIYSVTNKTNNTFDIIFVTDPDSTNTMILGNAVVYKTNLSIEKSGTINYYWSVGRQQIDEITFNTDLKPQISNFTFNSGTKTDYSDEAIIIYSARNETSYALWFDTTGTSAQPTAVSSYNKIIKLNISATSLTNAALIVDSIRQQLLLLDIVNDFTIESPASNQLQFTTTKRAASTNASVIATTTPPGTLNISSPTITAGVGSEQYADHIITIYSAENKVKYIIWFDPTGTGTAPGTLDLTASYVKIDLSSDELETKEDVCAAFIEQMNYNIYDFICDAKTTDTKTAIVKTSSSGSTINLATVTLGSGSDITISNIQKGIGLASAIGETTDNKYFLLSTNLSSSVANEESTKSLLNSINKNTNEKVYGYYISVASGLPGEFTLESREQDGVFFTFSSNNETIQTTTFNELLPQNSASENLPNRLFYSKQSQPDSVPLVNYFDVGPRDKQIKRIIGLRDSLFIFKEEGIYRLFGNISSNFQVVLFDSSSNITSTDSAVVLNNQIYVLTSQGVARVSETGVNIISRPIENLFTKVMNIPNYQWISFGISYEADRSYLLFVPFAEDDITSTKAFRFNTFTETWTSWEKNYNCGIVHPDQNKLYFGAVEDNYIEVERKNLSRIDYSDRVISNKAIIGQINNTRITLSNVEKINVGDSIVQNQKLTISQINRLINKVKNDTYLNPTEDIVINEAVPYDNLALKLSNIVTILNEKDVSLNTLTNIITTPGSDTITKTSHGLINNQYVLIKTSTDSSFVVNTFYQVQYENTDQFKLKDLGGSIITANGGLVSVIKNPYFSSGINIFTTLQNEFNGVISKLNASVGVFFTNYQQSIGTTEYEAHVKVFSYLNTQITIDNPTAFIVGECENHKGINCVVTYSPQHFGDPAIWKHVREAKIMFESDNFEGAYLGFNTDITNDYEEIAFSMEGNGSWGGVPWGNFTWGGEGLQVPFRTLIPRQKQRCRFIKARFRHVNSRNKFAIYGISFVFEGGTERTNK